MDFLHGQTQWAVEKQYPQLGIHVLSCFFKEFVQGFRRLNRSPISSRFVNIHEEIVGVAEKIQSGSGSDFSCLYQEVWQDYEIAATNHLSSNLMIVLKRIVVHFLHCDASVLWSYCSVWHPADANMCTNELKVALRSPQSDELLRRMSAYTANVTGSPSYWFPEFTRR
ncbi:hypothetical protein MP228_010457 [Amoeboaphelidium protococcarum]|nr:hypothetical protein MP228_010457 [Amoeboaphelidium protococcarum]